MIKVPDTVADLLSNDEIASEAFRAGLLNLSAYADQIKPQVEKLTFKEVKKNTIVVALSRLAKDTKSNLPALKPQVKLTNLSVKSPVVSLTYDKTVDMQRRVGTLHPFLISSNDLFALSEGPNEITLFCTEKAKESIKKHLGDVPVHEASSLVAISAQYTENYTNTPNVMHVLFSSLAAKRINLIEIVSTYSEVTFIVQKGDMEAVVKILNVYC